MADMSSNVDAICKDIEHEFAYCTKWTSKVDQYYRYGKLSDCSSFEGLHKDCFDWIKNIDKDSLKRIIDYDAKASEDRKRQAAANDIWTYRQAPPYDWNSKVRFPI